MLPDERFQEIDDQITGLDYWWNPITRQFEATSGGDAENLLSVDASQLLPSLDSVSGDELAEYCDRKYDEFVAEQKPKIVCEIRKTDGGEYWWANIARNGNVIANSAGVFENKRDCETEANYQASKVEGMVVVDATDE